ncbi:hypothetical protein J4423_02540 [Candidatus Pacearchaeota archaeon]|nr:hypothetical protein [Candidatus Pacearchaeota archaeon]
MTEKNTEIENNPNENRSMYAFGAFIAAIYYSFLGGQALVTKNRFRDMKEGFAVSETESRRMFYIGDTMGLARVCTDNNKDGVLDETLVNMPISAMMGGPGYRLMRVETTEEDRNKFERAKYLLKNFGGNK